jgi:hypothetical protein
MAWTNPTTRSTGNLITASIWNTDLVDNLNYIHSTFGVASFGLRSAGLLVVGDGKDYSSPIPAVFNGRNVTAVVASVLTKSTSGTPTFQIARGRQSSPTSAHTFVDVLTTKVTIDANEYSSLDAAAAYSINTSNDDVATGDIFRLDCDVAGTGTIDAFVTIGISV